MHSDKLLLMEHEAYRQTWQAKRIGNKGKTTDIASEGTGPESSNYLRDNDINKKLVTPIRADRPQPPAQPPHSFLEKGAGRFTLRN